MSLQLEGSSGGEGGSSLAPPAARHQWGVRLLAGSGAGSEADARQVDCGVPVEGFDVFCLAQRPGAPALALTLTSS